MNDYIIFGLLSLIYITGIVYIYLWFLKMTYKNGMDILDVTLMLLFMVLNPLSFLVLFIIDIANKMILGGFNYRYIIINKDNKIYDRFKTKSKPNLNERYKF